MKYLISSIFLISFFIACNQNDRTENRPLRDSDVSLDSSLLKIHLQKIKRHRKQNQFDSIFFYSKILANLSKEKSNRYYLGESKYFQGYAFYYQNQVDSSYYHFNRARNHFLKINDSIGIIKAMRAMALAQTKVGDYEGANQTSLAILDYVPKKKASQTRAEVYLILGYTATIQKDHTMALEYFNKALQDSITTQSKMGVYNNIVHNYIVLGENNPIYYKKASNLLDELEKDTYQLVHANILASVLDNRGFLNWKMNSNNSDNSLMIEALEMRRKNKDNYGLIFSYENLSEFYANSDRVKALKYTDSLYLKATELKDDLYRLDALKKKILWEKPKKAKEYAIQYNHLRDSMNEIRDKSIAEFAKIRFEITDKRNENTRLKSELVANQLKINRNKNITQLSIIFVVLLVICFIYYYRLQFLKNQKNLADELQKAEQKLSSKVHDELANSLYQTISFVDNIESFQDNSIKEKLIEKLDEVYKLSRDISRESQSIKTNEDYPQEIFSLISYYKSDTTNIILIGFKEEPWKNISQVVKLHFFKILQELLTNMSKHSQSSLVSLKFEFTPTRLDFTYSDNGLGMNPDVISPSNGLKNIANRLDIIKGKGNILPSQTGFKYALFIPIDLPKK
jgi:signal transduction histidine kinase